MLGFFTIFWPEVEVMPTYEYKCVKCQHQFEAVNKMSECESAQCPECGGQGEQEIRTVPVFSLKGTDWPGKRIKSNSTARK